MVGVAAGLTNNVCVAVMQRDPWYHLYYQEQQQQQNQVQNAGHHHHQHLYEDSQELMMQDQQQEHQPAQERVALLHERNLTFAAWLEAEDMGCWVQPFWSIVGDSEDGLSQNPNPEDTVLGNFTLEDLQQMFAAMPRANWVQGSGGAADLSSLFGSLGV